MGTTRIFVGLKLAILRNSFVKDARLRLGMIVLAALSVGGGSVGGWSFLQDSHRGPLSWSRSLPTGFSMIFLAWVAGPLLLGGVDDTLDPDRLVLFSLTRRELRTGLLVSSMVGFVTLGTVLALAGVVAGYLTPDLRGALVVVACVAELVLAVIAGRALSVALLRAGRSRRGRDVSVVVASLSVAVLWLGAQSFNVLSGTRFDRLVRVLVWTPAGSLGQAVIDARSGRVGVAATRIALALGLAWVLVRVWIATLERLLVAPPNSSAAGRRRSTGNPLLGHWPAGFARVPGLVVFVKELRYAARSPQRRSALIVGTLIGAPFALLQAMRLGGAPRGAVYYAPLAVIFGMGAANNLLGADASALWLELTTGTTMRALLFGRSMAAIPFVLLPIETAGVLIATTSGGWAEFGVMSALCGACWGVPIGVGCLVSVIAPLPQPDSGSPFSNRRPSAGEGCLVGVMAVASLLAVGVLLSPVVAGLVWFHDDPGRLWGLFVPAALAYSLGVWGLFLRIAAARATRLEAQLVHDLGQRRATV